MRKYAFLKFKKLYIQGHSKDNYQYMSKKVYKSKFLLGSNNLLVFFCIQVHKLLINQWSMLDYDKPEGDDILDNLARIGKEGLD